MAVEKIFCPNCGEPNGGLRRFCRACGVFFSEFADRKGEPQRSTLPAKPTEEYVAPFRDRVQLQVLLERVLPPYRPPVDQSGCILAVLVVVAAGIAMVGLSLANQTDSATVLFVCLIVAGLMIVIGVWHFWAVKTRAAVYKGLYGDTQHLAQRLLSSEVDQGDQLVAERKLAADIRELHRLGAPEQQGSSWFFFWWSDGGD